LDKYSEYIKNKRIFDLDFELIVAVGRFRLLFALLPEEDGKDVFAEVENVFYKVVLEELALNNQNFGKLLKSKLINIKERTNKIVIELLRENPSFVEYLNRQFAGKISTVVGDLKGSSLDSKSGEKSSDKNIKIDDQEYLIDANQVEGYLRSSFDPRRLIELALGPVRKPVLSKKTKVKQA